MLLIATATFGVFFFLTIFVQDVLGFLTIFVQDVLGFLTIFVQDVLGAGARCPGQ